MKIAPLFENSRINLLLIIDITLIVYLSVFVSGFSILDDTFHLGLMQSGDLTFSSLIPGPNMKYVRPLTFSTFLIEYNLFGINKAVFHGMNLFIHVLNSCLLYQVCRIYFKDHHYREGIALISALFFALAPINSESVAWVSGRTDLLCAFFFLAAILVLLDHELRPLTTFTGFFLFYFASLLAKETSIALVAIVPLFSFFISSKRALSSKIAIYSATTLVSLIYLIMRIVPKTELDMGTTKIVTGLLHQSVPALTYKTIAAIGFYCKKLLWPFPLNIAIQTINEPLYFLVGTIILGAALYIFIRFSICRLPLIIIITCLIPPLLALHGKVPWTLYAERYLYLPMTGFTLLAGVIISKSKPMIHVICCLLLIPLGLSTISRTSQWADPVALWGYTAEKSPMFPQVHVIFAYELIQAGRITDAVKSINRAQDLKFENELLKKCVDIINRNSHNHPNSSIKMDTPIND